MSIFEQEPPDCFRCGEPMVPDLLGPMTSWGERVAELSG